MKKKWLLPLLLLVVLAACRDRTPVAQEGSGRAALEASPLYRHFTRVCGEKEVLAWSFGDVNSDGHGDLILIYRVSGEKNAMRAVLSKGGTYGITNDVSAPASNQVITFKDMDGEPPMEFIVQGMKGNNIGYAVYRIEKESLVDLFGEGMDKCCG